MQAKVVPAKILQIHGRRRTNPTQLVSREDFALRELDGQSDDEVSTAVFGNTNIAPYCLDHESRQVIFAETPPDVDVSLAPFYYQGQFEAATRLIATPYDLAHQIAMRTGARFEELVLLYSVGRCGSTLISKLWQQVQDTYSVSEPDVFTHISQLRDGHQLNDGEAAQLLETAVRLLYQPRRAGTRFVVKFRARCIDLAELMYSLFPPAKLLFMYRNAFDCIDSHVRVFGDEPVDEPTFRRAFPLARDAAADYCHRLGRLGGPLVSWADGMQRYLAMRERGLPFAAVRYEDLARDPQRSIAQLLRHCAAPALSSEQISEVMAGDVQAGTKVARNSDGRRTLTGAEMDCIRTFLEQHTAIAPDGVLPGTVNV
jgi:Sulfotransferase family